MLGNVGKSSPGKPCISKGCKDEKAGIIGTERGFASSTQNQALLKKEEKK